MRERDPLRVQMKCSERVIARASSYVEYDDLVESRPRMAYDVVVRVRLDIYSCREYRILLSGIS